ncbi:MAG TPA: amidohydrolase [Bacteroidia bacterium]|jgi:predicted amidohydrolase|nr:amidohydrolase [Bacteroidia bacterium]
MNDLKVTLIQSNLFWENKQKNLEQFSKKIDDVNEVTDLIVLPEMFSTGFSMNPEKLAENMNGETVKWMKEKAQKKNCVVTGSFICEEGGRYYNRLLWVNPNGTYVKYDKRHLFSMGDEHNHYAAGEEKLIVELKGWKICPLICYDLRFPVWARNTKEASYDVLIYVANWPERRSYPWKTLLLARAIENQSYVIGSNRVGVDGNDISHSGDSAVIDAKGEIISKIKPNEEATETITLSYSNLVEFRKQFPAILDADQFEVKSMTTSVV